MSEMICVFEVCGTKQNINIKYQNIARVYFYGGVPWLVFYIDFANSNNRVLFVIVRNCKQLTSWTIVIISTKNILKKTD